MRQPRYSLVHEIRMVVAAILLTIGAMFFVLGRYDPLGWEAQRIDEHTRRATTIVLCAQMLTYDERLGQLQHTIDDVGLDGLTRNERQVWDSVSKAQGRLEAAEKTIGADCLPG